MPNQVKFVVYKDKAGGFRWRLLAGNGEPVASSQSYKSHQGAVNAAYTVRQIADGAIVLTEA